MKRILVVLPIVFLTGAFAIFGSNSSLAAEARCNELGANCVCSEPLNTLSYPIDPVTLESANPADSTVKECSTLSAGGAVEFAVGTDNLWFGDNDPAVLAKLPAGHSVNNYFRMVDGDTFGSNITFVGHRGITGFNKRTAVRFYYYHTPDIEFAFQGPTCTNTKFMSVGEASDAQIGGSNVIQLASGFAEYTYNGGANTVGGCCSSGPPTFNANVPYTTWRDHWLRFELVIVNRQGGASPNGIQIYYYMKDITAGTPEITVIDTTIIDPATGPDNGWMGFDDITPARVLDTLLMNFHQEGLCKGFRAASHFMIAGWNTDAGQRIGAALEVEGGGGPPPIKPNAPVLQKIP